MHAASTHLAAARLINDVQVFVAENPAAVHFLSLYAREIRRVLPSHVLHLGLSVKDGMAPQSDDAAAQEAAKRLIDLIQIYAVQRPHTIRAVERCVSEVLADEARQRIWDRLQRLSPEHVNVIEAAALQLEQKQHEE